MNRWPVFHVPRRHADCCIGLHVMKWSLPVKTVWKILTFLSINVNWFCEAVFFFFGQAKLLACPDDELNNDALYYRHNRFKRTCDCHDACVAELRSKCMMWQCVCACMCLCTHVHTTYFLPDNLSSNFFFSGSFPSSLSLSDSLSLRENEEKKRNQIKSSEGKHSEHKPAYLNMQTMLTI